jgi:hypothetical protein
MEFEGIETLATVRAVQILGWDALGEVLALLVIAGPSEEELRAGIPIALTESAARQLFHALRTALEEKGGEEWTRQ